MGTGSTAIVCKKMNRFFIGSEINKHYVDISLQRLQTEKLQPLFTHSQNYIQTPLL